MYKQLQGIEASALGKVCPIAIETEGKKYLTLASSRNHIKEITFLELPELSCLVPKFLFCSFFFN